MVLANKETMGLFKMKSLLKLIFIVILFFWVSCNNKHLTQKEYAHILDSLKQIEVPLVFDSIKFFQQRGNELDIDSMTPEGIRIRERQDDCLFYRSLKHKDSLFWDRFEYDCNGHLYRYYREYFNSCGDLPMGYVIYYNEQGEIESFQDGFDSDRETGLYATYNMYNVINKLKEDSIDLLKHNVYICYTKRTGRKDDYKEKHDKYYWIVGIKYYNDHKRLERKHMLRISPDTGEVLEDWIEEWP